MKNIIIFVIAISFIFSSCDGTGEPMDSTWFYYTIKNKTTHNIKIKVFDANMNRRYIGEDTTLLLPSLNSEIRYSFLGSPCTFGCDEDSAYIIFNDKKIITYIRGDSLHRNIIDINSWRGGAVEKHKYEYEYNITEEDYKKAVNIK